jgi:hypothetical protein
VNEKALASLNTTHDLYKSTTEKLLTASRMLSPFFLRLFYEYSLFDCRPNMKPFETL